MDILTVVPFLVTVASLLTNVIATPGNSAPAWWRTVYGIIELIALVGPATKHDPNPSTSTQLDQYATALAEVLKLRSDPP